MNKEAGTAHDEEAGTRTTSACLCGGLGAAVSQVMRAMGPTGEAANHFRQARIEALKGFRSILDEHIDSLSRATETKGTKVNVE